MLGIVHIEAVLKDPAGIWEHEQHVEYPAGAEKAIVMKMYAGVRAMGLVKDIDDTTVEIVPECRVVNYRISLHKVVLADNSDMAQAAARTASTNKLIL